MVTRASDLEIRNALTYREKWRFEKDDPAVEHIVAKAGHGYDEGNHGAVPDAGVGSRTEYGRTLARKADEYYLSPLFRARRSRILEADAVYDEATDLNEDVPRKPDGWDRTQRWNLIVAGPWQRTSEHINLKEARVCLMGLRRVCRSVQNMATTALTITDNLVSCLAFEKGRSRATALNKLCRRAAAYQLACRVQWRLRHIKSERNVADGPSRMWGPDFFRPGARGKDGERVRPKPAKDAHVSVDSFELGWSLATSSTHPLPPPRDDHHGGQKA